MIKASHTQVWLKVIICTVFTAIYSPPRNIHTAPSWHPLTNLTMLDAITCTLSVSEHKAWQRQNKNLAWYVVNSQLSVSDTLKALEYLANKEVNFTDTDSQQNNILHLTAQSNHEFYKTLLSLPSTSYPKLYPIITTLIKQTNAKNKTASEVSFELNNSITNLLSYSNSFAACAQESEETLSPLVRVPKLRQSISSAAVSTSLPPSVTSSANSSASTSTNPPRQSHNRKVQFSIPTYPEIQSSPASANPIITPQNTSTHAAALLETSFHSDDDI
jgi:hypothetical protein